MAKSIKDLLRLNESTVKRVVSSNVIIDVIYEALAEAVRKVVYDTYESNAINPYDRREDEGGLSDKANYNYKVEVSRNMFVVKVSNDTPANGNASDLASLIINGVGYDWQFSEMYNWQPYPRDFIKYARKRLINDGILKRVLKSELKKYGINLVD